MMAMQAGVPQKWSPMLTKHYNCLDSLNKSLLPQSLEVLKMWLGLAMAL